MFHSFRWNMCKVRMTYREYQFVMIGNTCFKNARLVKTPWLVCKQNVNRCTFLSFEICFTVYNIAKEKVSHRLDK